MLWYNETLKKFSASQRKEILKRDGYKCVICGLGERDGVDLQVDHIKPKSLGGKASTDNGQTLCSRHNLYQEKLKAYRGRKENVYSPL